MKMPHEHDINNLKLVGLQDRRRKLTDEQKAEIIRLRDEGWSMRKLAEEDDANASRWDNIENAYYACRK